MSLQARIKALEQRATDDPPLNVNWDALIDPTQELIPGGNWSPIDALELNPTYAEILAIHERNALPMPDRQSLIGTNLVEAILDLAKDGHF